MFSEFIDYLSDWGPVDTWIVITAALAAMACALPGTFLVLRRQSMMGDALSHTTLLGIAAGFLAAYGMKAAGWIDPGAYFAARHAVMFSGAMIVGVLAAVLTEWIQKLGRVEASAALGVVFTTMFAVGLLLIRIAANTVDLDPDCVLYGNLESAYVGDAAWTNGVVLAANLLLLAVFYKELRISAFDPALATALGFNSTIIHYALMAVTAATTVAAFESVGSILVIAMLIAPPATAHLLTDRFGRLIGLSLAVAALSAVLGHVMAITLPGMIFSRIGLPEVQDAGTAGMVSVAAGLLFSLAMLFGPRHGIVSKMINQTRLALKIVSEDLLGLLYRLEESRLAGESRSAPDLIHRVLGVGRVFTRLAMIKLKWDGQMVADAAGYHLTAQGREAGKQLVRSHRLWESYLAKHFALPDDHLHDAAHRVEHYLGPDLRQELASELDQPDADPHGRSIPPERD